MREKFYRAFLVWFQRINDLASRLENDLEEGTDRMIASNVMREELEKFIGGKGYKPVSFTGWTKRFDDRFLMRYAGGAVLASWQNKRKKHASRKKSVDRKRKK